MGYSELVQWMFNLERFGIKLGLENMTEYLSRIENPHKCFRSVHVTGTNGKGSVCAFLASILEESGLKVGLYTSPHLVDFRERVKINGQMISEEDVVKLGNELRATMEGMAEESGEQQLTFFEFTTGLAFKYFNEQRVDVAVVEVGMGGRLDATNVISPEVSVITRIGQEHTAYLGHTMGQIAREKAGIVKTDIPVVCSDRNPESLSVIRGACERKEAKLILVGKDFGTENVVTRADSTSFDYDGRTRISGLRTRLIGTHQAENAATAIAVTEQMMAAGYSISESAVREGVAKTRLSGRLDIWSNDPLVILDGSHNPEGVRTTVSVIDSLGLTPLTFVVACMEDKDGLGMIAELAPYATKMVITEVKTGRSVKATQLAVLAKQSFDGEVSVEENVQDAMAYALSNASGEGVCAIGSFYLVGDVMRWLRTPNLNRGDTMGARKV
ncbi:MAG: bifunctional folylpolyglutamate synthase/dihydrofolate synthase [Candidatus Thermoplasmatota archaeon]|nr:bifunctional folylpolyglutamate synthase/dihydrofolate synthase [Candidatus Thermoplasmatota archaeon]